MKYKVVINTPSRMILINGKLSRTPLTAIIDEKQLLFVKTKITAEGILNYSITPHVPEIIVEKKEEPEPIIVQRKKNKKDIIDSSTTLGKIFNEEPIDPNPSTTLEKTSNEEIIE